MIIRILLLLLIMPFIASAVTVNLTSGMLPYNAHSHDTLTISGTHISSATNGIYIGNWQIHGVVLNFGTDTIEFGTAGGNSNYGVKSENSTYGLPGDFGLRAYGGTILRNQGAGIDAGSTNRGVWIVGRNHDILFDSTTIIVDGHDAQAARLEMGYSDGGGAYNMDFYRCHLISNSESFTSRESYSGAVVYVWPCATTLTGEQYHVRVRNSYLSGPHIAIATSINYNVSSALIQVYNDTFDIDARNVYWDTIYLGKGLDTPVGRSADNCYAILGRFIRAGSSIHDNLIRSGNQHQGSRGIMIENSTGTVSAPINVYNNILDLHSGPTGENAIGVMRGISVRVITEGIGTYINVYKNTIYTTSDNSSGTTAIGQETNGLQFWITYVSPTLYSNHIKIDSNTVYARSLTAGTNTKGAEFRCNTDTAGSSFSHNYIYSSGVIMRAADEYNGSGYYNNMLFRNNHYEFIPTADSFVQSNPKTWKMGLAGHTGSAVGLDNTYSVGASETDMQLYCGNLTHKRTMRIATLSESSLMPVSGIHVWVTDKNDNTVLDGTSDANGIVTGAITYIYGAYGSSTVNYNPFKVYAARESDTITHDNYIVSSIPSGAVDTFLFTIGEPVISIPTSTKNYVDSLTDIYIYATDGIGIDSVWAYIWLPDSTPGINDSVNILYEVLGGYIMEFDTLLSYTWPSTGWATVVVEATDIDGNNSTESGDFYIVQAPSVLKLKRVAIRK